MEVSRILNRFHVLGLRTAFSLSSNTTRHGSHHARSYVAPSWMKTVGSMHTKARRPIAYRQHVQPMRLKHDLTTSQAYAIPRSRFLSAENHSTEFTKKQSAEAFSSGAVDIHDISPPDPKGYDVLLTDVGYSELSKDLSEILGVQYLSVPSVIDEQPARELFGVVYGYKQRTIVPVIVTRKNISIWVFFIIDPTSPITYLSSQCADIFGINEDDYFTTAKVAGHNHSVNRSPTKSHFSDVNLLGADFIMKQDTTMTWTRKKVKIILGE